MVNTITGRQSDFLVTLVKERDTTDVEPVLDALRQDYRQGTATRDRASFVIDTLLKCPKKSFKPGIYEIDSNLYRVYLGRESGRMLCKRVVVDSVSNEITYEYAGAADSVLKGARRLPRQEVAERTLSYGLGTCLVCGRRLDDPESVDRGVGPVCWENYS